MQTAQPNLLTRDDTFFGVCEGLGEDFGIHPNFLRVAMAGLLFWHPELALAVYLGAGLVVALTRWLVPNPSPVFAEDAPEAGGEAVHADAAQAEPAPAPMPLAA